MQSFNLIDEDWIPCLIKADEGEAKALSNQNVQTALLGLNRVFLQARKIKQIVGDSPPVTIAIHRLLSAILHRCFGPKSANDWKEIWDKRAFDEKVLSEYFQRWHHRFDIFDEQYPFFQVAALDFNRGVSAARLRMDNYDTLFDHNTEGTPPILSPAQAARLLIAYQAFDTGGIKTAEKDKDFADASPLIQSAIGLIRGGNLFETLLLNLHRYDEKDEEPFAFDWEKDKPAWERDEVTQPADRFPDGYVDLLTWQSRRLRLQPEETEKGETIIKRVVIMKGYQFPDGFQRYNKETMAAFKKRLNAKPNEVAWFPIGFSEEKALWRDSTSLFQSISEQHQRLRMLTWLADLAAEGVLEWSQTLPIDFFGLAADRAKLLFWRHESLMLPLDYLRNEELFTKLRIALSLADKVGEELREKARNLAKLLLASSSNKPTARQPHKDDVASLSKNLAIERIYWSGLEELFKRFVLDLPKDQTETLLNNWAETLNNSALSAFTVITRSLDGSARSLKAVAAVEPKLRANLHSILKEYF